MNPPKVTGGDLLHGLTGIDVGGHLLAPAGKWKRVDRCVVVTTPDQYAGWVWDTTYEFDTSEAAVEFCRGLESINLGFTRKEEFA